MGIKFRLIVMNFLQYAIWGSWLISLGAYLGGGLDFTGLQIGSFFATMGVASLFMPAVMGIIADLTVVVFGSKPNNAFNLFISYITIDFLFFSLFSLPHFHNPIPLFFRGEQR